MQSEKSANSRKVIAVKIAAYTSQLVQTNISWLQPERGRLKQEKESEKEVDLSFPGNRTTLLSTTPIFCTLSHFIDI